MPELCPEKVMSRPVQIIDHSYVHKEKSYFQDFLRGGLKTLILRYRLSSPLVLDPNSARGGLTYGIALIS